MPKYEDKLREHEIDGINEYDNPMPTWLVTVLWGTVVFAVLYIGFYALAFGPASMQTEYRDEMVRDRGAIQAYFVAHPMVPPSAAALLGGAVDPATLTRAKARFTQTCAPCHGEAAQGLIGPNLTDTSWIHGGKVVEIFTTIAKGVPAKGMPVWGRSLPPDEIAALASYVRSLQGTNPAQPKPPEGVVVGPEPLPTP